MAAIYLRVSTDRDEQKRSPEHQLMTCLDHANDIGLETKTDYVYNDAGQSGTEMQHRTEVQRLVADARDGKFDAILFTAISRFARDLSDALSLKKRLETIYGVRIISVEEGYDSAIDGRNSEMVFTVHAMVAAHKSQEMSKSIRRGLRQSAASGHHIGSVPPYGYAKTSDKHLVPDTETAHVVQLIYQLYCCGLGVNAIAKELSRRGIATSRSRKGLKTTLWQASTVNAILHNPVYTGTLVANKWRKSTDIHQSRLLDAKVTRQMRRQKAEWIVIDNNHEPLIDQATYDHVQQRLRHKEAHRGVRLRSNLLSGMMRCGSCGRAMIVTGSGKSESRSYKYVLCSSVKRIGKHACDNHCRVPYRVLLEAVLSPLSKITPSSTCIQALTARMSHPSIATDTMTRVAKLQQQMETTQHKRQAALRAYTEKLFTVGEFRQLKSEFDEEIARLSDDIDSLRQLQEEREARDQSPDKHSIDRYVRVFDGHRDRHMEAVRTALQCMVTQVTIDAKGTIRIAYKWRSTPTKDSLNTSLT